MSNWSFKFWWEYSQVLPKASFLWAHIINSMRLFLILLLDAALGDVFYRLATFWWKVIHISSFCFSTYPCIWPSAFWRKRVFFFFSQGYAFSLHAATCINLLCFKPLSTNVILNCFYRSYALTPVYEAATRPIEETTTSSSTVKAESDDADAKDVVLPGVSLLFDGVELHPFDIGACLQARQPIALIAEASSASASFHTTRASWSNAVYMMIVIVNTHFLSLAIWCAHAKGQLSRYGKIHTFAVFILIDVAISVFHAILLFTISFEFIILLLFWVFFFSAVISFKVQDKP